MDSNTWVEVNYTQLVANAQRLLPLVKPGTIAMAMVKVRPCSAGVSQQWRPGWSLCSRKQWSPISCHSHVCMEQGGGHSHGLLTAVKNPCKLHCGESSLDMRGFCLSHVSRHRHVFLSHVS